MEGEGRTGEPPPPRHSFPGESIRKLSEDLVAVGIQGQRAPAGLRRFSVSPLLGLQPFQTTVKVRRIRLKGQSAPIGRRGGFPIPQAFLCRAQPVMGAPQTGEEVLPSAGGFWLARFELALAKSTTPARLFSVSGSSGLRASASPGPTGWIYLDSRPACWANKPSKWSE